ncbi:MAG: dihydrofolate reductase family protein [Bryobacteraceae bacterium]
MANLIYIAITSLDGYVEDQSGRFDWAVPDEEVHTFVNDLLRPVGIYLYGRRMYQTMVGWETMDTAAEAPFTRDFAEIWRAADKIVYSRTLEKISSARTRIERDFDPEPVRRTKLSAERDIAVAGASLAAHAIKAGLVDEYHLIISPILVGGGKRFLPNHVLLRLDSAGRTTLRQRRGSPPIPPQTGELISKSTAKDGQPSDGFAAPGAI